MSNSSNGESCLQKDVISRVKNEIVYVMGQKRNDGSVFQTQK